MVIIMKIRIGDNVLDMIRSRHLLYTRVGTIEINKKKKKKTVSLNAQIFPSPQILPRRTNVVTEFKPPQLRSLQRKLPSPLVGKIAHNDFKADN